MQFEATKAKVHNRGAAPDSFLEALVLWGRKASDLLFAPRRDDEGETDIYTAIKPDLGPWTSPEHRRAAMLEVLRVLGGYEASWRLNEGRDTNNPTENNPETKSAGVFQISYNSRNFGPDLKELIRAAGILNGDDFQAVMKSNLPFAMTYTASLLRHTIRHNGPVKRGEINEWLSREAVQEFQQLLAGEAAPAPATPVPADDAPVDARSEKAIATLHPRVQPVARQLIRNAKAAGIEARITSGTRTYEEQNALYEQGRSKPGKIVTNARGGHSNHNHGIAIDLTIFRNGQPVWESPEYKTLGKIGKALGFTWGGDWESISDEPHFELHPPWAKNLSESDMLAELRDRHNSGADAWA